MPKTPTLSEIKRAFNVLGRVSTRELQRLGYHFQANDYYSPINDCDFLEENRDIWSSCGTPLEIDWNLAGQLEVVRSVGRYVEELSDIPQKSTWRGKGFYWNNNFWETADALVQYGLVRSERPKKVVEIGCGFSSLLLKRALEANQSACNVDLVEPYPNGALFAQLPREWVHHECALQRAPLALFQRLEAGDICFYDGSHCVRTGSDVNWFFFEVLPRLAPGVLIHLHDIFLPEPYPDNWLFDRCQSWNEQFLLQAFLMHNKEYKIVIANRYIWREKREFLEKQYRGMQAAWGCSLWMTKVKLPPP